jgi:hypothetical protein
VICNSELVLKEVIGSGAEGKVGWLAGMLAGYACRICLQGCASDGLQEQLLCSAGAVYANTVTSADHRHSCL